jgi:UDP-glucuronate 4-epimerase
MRYNRCMKILVTGYAGFVGSNTVEYFLSKGYTVVGLDNFDDFYSKRVKEHNIESFKNHPNFKEYRVDILDRDMLDQIFNSEKFDSVIHLAARANVTKSVKEPHIYATNNYVGTDNLAECSVKYGVKAFIFASTSSIYGNKDLPPFVETMNTDYPSAPYPASKKGCEVLLYGYSLNFPLNVTVFRFFNPIGPKLRPDLAITKLFRSAIYNGSFEVFQDAKSTSRDYTYIVNMCKAMESAIGSVWNYEIFNLGNSNNVALEDLIKNVEEITKKPINLIINRHSGQMTHTLADISKAKQMLNYNPKETIKDMLSIYYEWFNIQPEWYKRGEY